MKYFILLFGLIFLLFSHNLKAKSLRKKKSVENIETFAKIYGYVRYFHPSDQATLQDWDQFLMRGISEIKDIPTNRKLAEKLHFLFQSVAPKTAIYYKPNSREIGKNHSIDNCINAENIFWQYIGMGNQSRVFKSVRVNALDQYNQAASSSPVQETLFEAKIHTDEVIEKYFKNGIFCVVPLSICKKDQLSLTQKSIFVEAEKKDYIDTTAKNNTVKGLWTANIIKAWNIFRHFYPYSDEMQIDWDALLHNSLVSIQEAKTQEDFMTVLSLLTEKLNDGHIYITTPSEMKSRYTIPAEAVIVEKKIIISKVDSNIFNKSLKVGDEILEIDGRNALELFDKKRKNVSGSPQWKNNVTINQIFLGERYSEILIKIKTTKNEVKEVHLLRGLRLKDRFPDFPSREIDKDIYYINLCNTKMWQINDLLPKLNDSKHIIFDLRGYPKDDFGQLLSCFMKKADTVKWFSIPRIIYPDYAKVTYLKTGWNINPSISQLRAKAYFLVNANAISYAESLLGFIKYYHLGIIVGEPTAGANGDVNFFDLMGGYNVRFSGVKVRNLDGTKFQSIGIKPDIFIKSTIKGIQNGKDEILEQTILMLRSSNVE
nr:S41 family peptidase [uncultured Pedobacter sp.]